MSFNVQPTFENEGTYTPDNLLTGHFPVVTESAIIATGQDLTRGAVLGKVTASGKYILSLAAAGDGSEDPVAILAEDVDATAADKEVTIYKTGGFNQRALSLGAGHTVATVKAALEPLSIFIRDTVAA